jgi:hypothetical protein
MPNQWPDFATMAKPKTIRSVIIEEGAGISEKTNGAIRFEVDSSPHGKGGFVHYCSLVAIKVAYRYPLLRVVQDGLDYPVTVIADTFPQGAAAGNEEELRKDLGLVFRSDVTKRVVLQLLDLLS